MSREKTKLIFDCIFYGIIIVGIMFSAISFFKPNMLKNYKDNDNDLIVNEKTYNELNQCLENYISTAIYKNKFKLKSMLYYSLSKNDRDINELSNKLQNFKGNDVLIKDIYMIKENIYKCYFFKEKVNNIYMAMTEKANKEDMYSVIIELNPSNETFIVLSGIM